LAVCVDARRQHIYAAIYDFKNGSIHKVLKDSLLSSDELLRKVGRVTFFTGDALPAYGDILRKRLGKKALFLKPAFWYPRALFLIQLLDSIPKWLKPLTLRTMTPEYLRSSEAEERTGKKN
ncbi:MAG: hypothetical protein HY584_01655, partial [Candidatus Omnitrophica bacterium]|nr:hypothetical protein [Candidatus Omnitrophota bacterium]